MNIAFYIGDFQRSGGTERACISVANGLSELKGLNIFLFVTNCEGEKPFFEIDRRVSIVYLNVKNVKKHYFILLNAIYQAIKTHYINVIVAVEVLSLLFLWPVFIFKRMGMLRVELFVWEHFNYTVSLGKKTRNFMRKCAARFADVIVVLTKKDIELWETHLNVKAKMVCISNPSPFKVSTKVYNRISKNIIAVGRLTYQKGFDRLLDIWSDFIRKDPQHGWLLQIIGSGPDSKDLREQATKLGLDSSIEWVENTPEIEKYYGNAAFLVMTSRFEGLPMTLIEAQSFGLPIIAYNCLTGPEEVVSFNSGFLIDDGDRNGFVDNLNTICQSVELREKMSSSAKEEVNRFFISNIIANWASVLNKQV